MQHCTSVYLLHRLLIRFLKINAQCRTQSIIIFYEITNARYKSLSTQNIYTQKYTIWICYARFTEAQIHFSRNVKQFVQSQTPGIFNIQLITLTYQI